MAGPAQIHSASDTPSKRPATPAKDLEYGYPPVQAAQPTTARPPSDKSTDHELAWNAQHPCYPHPNPHVPLSSQLHTTTRIIRIQRDWMVAGDLAPTFSNTYPEILEPWISEQDFRTLIKGVNERMLKAFDPLSWRATADTIMGVATGWIWEDLGFTGVKKGCAQTEAFIEGWNGSRRNTLEKDDDSELVRAIPLRRTGYTCLDIQIPDPRVGVINANGEREEERKTIAEDGVEKK